MKIKLTFLVLIVGFLGSCKKETHITNIVPANAKLTYRILDDKEKGLPGINVHLFEVLNAPFKQIKIASVVTDATGMADFGDLSPQNYSIEADTPPINNVDYIVREFIQLIPGKDIKRTVKVSDFSGTLNFQLLNNQGDVPGNSLGFLLIADGRANSWKLSDLERIAEFSGVTNEKGEGTVKIPSLRQWTLVYYYLETGEIPMMIRSIIVETNQVSNLRWLVRFP